MDYKLYKTPNSANRLDTSIPYEKSIADLLLTFDHPTQRHNRVVRVVTVANPASETGWSPVASQLFQDGQSWRAFVLSDSKLYEFRAAKVSIRSAGERFLKAGLTGLLLGAEKSGFVSQVIGEDYFPQNGLSPSSADPDDWYHFTGTAENILEELQKKCALSMR